MLSGLTRSWAIRTPLFLVDSEGRGQGGITNVPNK
jgi:hypothetical protein